MDFARLNKFMDLSRRFRELSMASTLQGVMGVGPIPHLRKEPPSLTTGVESSLERALGAAESSAPGQLLEVHGELKTLLGGPAATLPSDAEVSAIMADCLDLAAGSYGMARDFDTAATLYQQAADSFRALGRTAEAERCARKVLEMNASSGKGVDQELAAMHARARAAGTLLEYAEAHADLAEASARLGDEYATREHVETALRALRESGIEPPGGRELASGLRDTLSGASGGIVSALAARFLFQRLWMTGASVFAKTEPERAAEFRKQLADSGALSVNREFAETMLAERSAARGEK